MKISVIGTGYVGLTLVCLADFSHDIIFIGRTQSKVDLINSGKSPIYEPGLEEILEKNIKLGRVHATTDYSSVIDSDVVFLCVGTPSRDDGSIDLSDIEKASAQIGGYLKQTQRYIVVVVKSTVVPWTTLKTVLPALEKNSGKKAGEDFGVCMNPEFLREGTGVYDFLNPDKIVLGCIDDKSYFVLEKIYEHFDKKFPRIKTDPTTAEMIKYAQNSMLATRISFINEIANICEKYGVDVKEVAYTIGLDKRIGPKFLNAGVGFGGSCFPKDVKALVAAAHDVDVEPILLKDVLKINEKQPFRMIELAEDTIGNLTGKLIAVLGLAFKSDTDDMRESRSIPIIKALIERGAKVKAYDPKAIENAKTIFDNSIEYCSSKEECIKGADICLIVTEWDEFKNLNLDFIKCPIIDGRRIMNPLDVKKHGIVYKGIGWKNDSEQ